MKYIVKNIIHDVKNQALFGQNNQCQMAYPRRKLLFDRCYIITIRTRFEADMIR